MPVGQNQFTDPNYKGEDYQAPKHLEDGPQKERKCTDVLFAIIYFLFVSAMIGCSVYGYVKGSPAKLFAPIDAEGHICGYDPGYTNYPYLFIWDINSASSSLNHIFDSAVCVT